MPFWKYLFLSSHIQPVQKIAFTRDGMNFHGKPIGLSTLVGDSIRLLVEVLDGIMRHLL